MGGSSGECIYQSLDERKAVLSYLANNLKGKMTLIAHVGAPSTRDSIELTKHATSLGYDALSAIPPIYFKLPDSAVTKYWSDIMEATPLPFIIYNIPQTTGYTLTPALFEKLLTNKKVIGVKNSSMPPMDIERFKRVGGKDVVVFNGPDEQYVAGRIMEPMLALMVLMQLCRSCSCKLIHLYLPASLRKQDNFKVISTISSSRFVPSRVLCMRKLKRF